MFDDRFLFRRPDSEVNGGAADKMAGHWVVTHGLNGLVVLVFENTDQLLSPDYNGLVSTACKATIQYTLINV